MDTAHRSLLAVPALTALVSAVLYVPTLPSGPSDPGSIRLEDPIHEDDQRLEPQQTSHRLNTDDSVVEASSNIDRLRPEDSDGVPIAGEEALFWRRMNRFKLLNISLILIPTLMNLLSLGFYLGNTSDHSSGIATSTLAIHLLCLSVHICTLCFAGIHVSQNNVAQHWATTVHMATILSVTWLCQAVFVMLPDATVTRGNNDLFAPLPHTSREMALVQANIALQPLLLFPALVVIVAAVRRGPQLYFPMEKLYSKQVITSLKEQHAEKGSPATSIPDSLNDRIPNVTPEVSTTIIGTVLFLHVEPLLHKAKKATSFNVWDLPILQRNMRSMFAFRHMKNVYGDTRKLKRRYERRGIMGRIDRLPEGYNLLAKVFIANKGLFMLEMVLAASTAGLYYLPAVFLQQLTQYLQENPDRKNIRYGWVMCFSLAASNALMYLAVGMLWYITSTQLANRIKLQLSTLLFSKTLVKKDLAATKRNSAKAEAKEARLEGNGGSIENDTAGESKDVPLDVGETEEDEEDVSSKAQIMTLFTVDVDRVADFTFHTFSLIDSPIELLVGSVFLYKLLGTSALWGMAASIFTLPLNHYASKVVVDTQDELMKARDERTAIMNEVLGAIRMIKFMAWERKFEEKVTKIRSKELKYLRRNYIIEVVLNWVWATTPVAVTLVTFFHYVVIAQKPLTPAVAFPSVSVLNELQYSLSALPETVISVLQGFVSLRRIQKYLSQAEVAPGTETTDDTVALRSATLTWPRDVASGTATGYASAAPSGSNTPSNSAFTLADVNIEFPIGKLSVVAGRLGAGKTLLLLGLLGEADLLAGNIQCPRSPVSAISDYGIKPRAEEWILQGRTAFASQVPFLINASLRQNVIFGAPEDEVRFRRVIKACSLESDLELLEDGEWTEIGEKGLGLSGGQRARVSLARAIYSRARTILLDDIISALDAHTTKAIVEDLFQGDLTKNRTVILVTHHIKLLVPVAAHVVLLDNGDVKYTGPVKEFVEAGHMEEFEEQQDVKPLFKSDPTGSAVEKIIDSPKPDPQSAGEVQPAAKDTTVPETAVPSRPPRKLVEDEARQTGGIAWKTWKTYIQAQGSPLFWIFFALIIVIGACPPLLERSILNKWSASYSERQPTHSPFYFITLYAIATMLGTIASQSRFAVLYLGSLRASEKIHRTMLERVLLATIRFHDTSVRGRTLNRFGKDMEGLDSSTADSFGRTIFYFLNVVVTLGSITWVGGWRFMIATVFLGLLYNRAASLYGPVSRDLRRLDSLNRSPLYATFSEVIGGIQTIRAYGASRSMMERMTKISDANISSAVLSWTVSRWVSARFNLLSSAIVGLTGVVVLVTPTSASLAGFALTFALSVSNDLLFVVRRWVQLQQALVAVERLDEYCQLPVEAAEYTDQVPAHWPHAGKIEVDRLSIQYAPSLPTVLHGLSFTVEAGQKIGIVGATGCGKSTLALSLFRFVEPTSGTIKIDGIDITQAGLAQLRSRVTIIPQDPTILSGTLRSTLDIFSEYDDAAIFEALRRVHLLKSEEHTESGNGTRNRNLFASLETDVSEGGDNFSQGEKQLLCLARSILRDPKILVMDEATASIDYETDELISRTIREEFSNSTLLTIAHRLTTIIDYDKILLLENGRIAEFDSPHNLLMDDRSKFYSLCEATGRVEFANLLKAAGVATPNLVGDR